MGKKSPKITEYRINADIPRLRIALLTDLHNTDFRPIQVLLSSQAPDMIVISGDLYEGPPRQKEFAFANGIACLSYCASIAPVFYSQGNHDMTLPPEVENVIKKVGVHLLCNEFVTFRSVLVGGLTSAYYRTGNPVPDLFFARNFSEKQGYKILICHHPEYYRRYLKELSIDLILSGHNHGGQWELFGHGVYVPGQFLFPPHTAGVFDGRLVVSRGLSNNVWVPRINNPTELVMLTVGKRP